MNPPPVICPNCNRAIPSEPAATFCPFCGHQLRKMATLSTSEWNAWGWMLFWVILLAPAALSFLLLPARSSMEQFLGKQAIACGVAAVFCGIWYAVKLTQRTVLRIVAAILLVVPFWLISFFLCFLGCAFLGR